MSFWYLASPYSKYSAGIFAAYADACQQAALLVRAGVPVFSPIAHSHGIAEFGEIDPADHEIWLPADAPFMDAAHGIVVCKLPGWDKSRGVQHEIDVFQSADKPVVYMEPGVVPEVLL